MSKKIIGKEKGLNVLGLIQKAKNLCDEYGETVMSVSESLGLKKKASQKEAFDELVSVQQNETSLAMKSLRAEVEADDSFHESLSVLEDAASIAFDGRITNPEEVSKALQSLISVAQETIRYSEEQETRREEIRAIRDEAIARVNAMRDAVQAYLDKSFDERNLLFAKQFECVDAALKSGDNEMLATSLNSINSLAASSPFRNLADLGQLKTALSSSDTEWDI